MKRSTTSESALTEESLLQILTEAKSAAEAGRIEQVKTLLDQQLIANVNKVINADPSRTDLMLLMANIFHAMRELRGAEHYYRKALDYESNLLAYINLGHICHFTGRLTEAIEYRNKAIQLRPDDPSVYRDLGCSLIFAGEKTQGVEMLRKAVEMAPDDAGIHSNYLFRLHHLPTLDRPMLFNEHKRWAQIHAPAEKAAKSHKNDSTLNRRLRIGYLSPDFRTHPVAYFFESLLDGHDREAVETYGYGNVTCPDSVTERIAQKFDHYQNIHGLCDSDVAELVRADKIDIAVDLAGHTAGNCLGALAHRPAPIAVTYLGYPDTTGMRQIDYRFTDDWADTDESQCFCTEELIRLPGGFLCYRPPEFAPEPARPPVERNGHITFGSFNNSSKINARTISLWAQILNTVTNSRLLIKSRAGDDHGMRDNFFRQFEQFGISRDRIEIHGQKPAIEYMQLYNSVDIALDTFPYNGATTTCDAMWMGVSVISMTGEHHASRVGLSILTRLGLEFFAASERREFVAKAAALAQNPKALADIRLSMRQRMTESTLCNAGAFARTVEKAYRKMWHKWCRNQGVETPSQESLADIAASRGT